MALHRANVGDSSPAAVESIDVNTVASILTVKVFGYCIRVIVKRGLVHREGESKRFIFFPVAKSLSRPSLLKVSVVCAFNYVHSAHTGSSNVDIFLRLLWHSAVGTLYNCCQKNADAEMSGKRNTSAEFPKNHTAGTCQEAWRAIATLHSSTRVELPHLRGPLPTTTHQQQQNDGGRGGGGGRLRDADDEPNPRCFGVKTTHGGLIVFFGCIGAGGVTIFFCVGEWQCVLSGNALCVCARARRWCRCCCAGRAAAAAAAEPAEIA